MDTNLHEKRIADLTKSHKVVTALGRDEEYRKRLDIADKVVLDHGVSAATGTYYYELADQTKIPARCPRCYEGTLALREFRCINTTDSADILYVSLIRCVNTEYCTFLTSDTIAIIAGKITEKGLQASKSKSVAQLDRSKQLTMLEEQVTENSWLNIFKATFTKMRGSVFAVIATVIILAALMGLGALLNYRFNTVNVKLLGASVTGTSGVLDETDGYKKMMEVCNGYIGENRAMICR